MRKKIENTIAALLNLFLLRTILRWYEDSNSEVIKSIIAVMASKMLKSPKSKGSITMNNTPLHSLYDIQR
jgi:hypothetical protein